MSTLKNSIAMPFNLHAWIDEHRHLLKPPVCNKQIFEQDNFIVMIVGGPNNRTDYHYNETPELFYQIEGEMLLSVIDGTIENNDHHNAENFHDITIKAGEIFLLPPRMLHSPQRFENSVGLVVEQKRANKQEDALYWFCPDCKSQLYTEAFCLDNIETDLPKVFTRFYDTPAHCTCQQCGITVTKG